MQEKALCLQIHIYSSTRTQKCKVNKLNIFFLFSSGDKWSLHVSHSLLLPQRRQMSVLSVHRRTCLQVRKHIWHPPSVPGLGHVFIRFLMFLLFIRCSEGFTGQRCQFKKAMKFQSPGITGKGSKYFYLHPQIFSNCRLWSVWLRYQPALCCLDWGTRRNDQRTVSG